MIVEVRRYFIGLVGFAFVMCWATAGLLAAVGGLAVCAGIVWGPEVVAGSGRSRRRRPARVRPLAQERPAGYDLVPDDPSLVVELV